ncbi:hypothetical protein AHAS_Ahas15G0135300 [Arachis hypogaea]
MIACDARLETAPQVSRAYELKNPLQQYLHHCCGLLVIHGDIKLRNILLDSELRAIIGDFGLARVKEEVEVVVVAGGGDEECDRSSAVKSVRSRNKKRKSFAVMRVLDSDMSSAAAGTSPEVGLEKGSFLSDGVSVESKNQKRKSDINGGDFGRAGIGGRSRTMIKDYLME